MSEKQILPADQVLTARSAIWLACPDCDHTTRTLAVMASRVLSERRQCPGCHSTQVPHMSQTMSGAHIPSSEAHQAAQNDGDEAYLRAWIERGGNKKRPPRSVEMFLRWLAPPFSRTRPAGVQAEALPVVVEPGLQLATAEDDLS